MTVSSELRVGSWTYENKRTQNLNQKDYKIIIQQTVGLEKS